MNAKILLVDDEEVVVRSCLRVLAGNGYQIDTHTDGRSALKAVGAVHYDLIILDLMMPDIGGMEVLEKVKESHPDIKVILITGLAQVETSLRAMERGAFAYLPKPFDPDELTSLVARALESDS
jgi:DNA-binding NtrC family response regulator